VSRCGIWGGKAKQRAEPVANSINNWRVWVEVDRNKKRKEKKRRKEKRGKRKEQKGGGRE
jgi:hypothetical protein